MILVDTSVWVDHFSDPDPDMIRLLEADKVLAHPFVIGELTMGSQPKRDLLKHLFKLKQTVLATDPEVLHFVAIHNLHGVGIGYLDAHLLASVQMTPDTMLWTRDKRLAAVAANLSLSFTPALN
ncbi:MAG: type II toxin-antitoxin system VapC family toxin [Acidobacteriaceae bacterium]